MNQPYYHPLNTSMTDSCLEAVDGFFHQDHSKEKKEEMFRTYMKNFDSYYMLFFNSLHNHHSPVSSIWQAKTYLIGMLAVHFSFYIEAGEDKGLRSMLLFEPRLFAVYGSLKGENDLTTAELALSQAPGLLERVQNVFTQLECQEKWTEYQECYFKSWWGTWKKGYPGAGQNDKESSFVGTSSLNTADSATPSPGPEPSSMETGAGTL